MAEAAMLTQPPSTPTCRKDKDCPKNHVVHTANRQTGEAFPLTIHLEHHKNSGKHGPLDIKVVQQLSEVWELMEQAAAWLAPTSRCFFFPFSSQELYGRDSHTEHYFSITSTAILSGCGLSCCYQDIRHLYGTLFSMYLGQATLTAEDVGIDHMRQAASSLMGTSTLAWDRTYDASARQRAHRRVVAHYPAFREFVRADMARQQVTAPRNPITGRVG